MKVKELIAKLNEFNQDTEVLFWDGEFRSFRNSNIDEDHFINDNGQWEYIEEDETGEYPEHMQKCVIISP